MSAMKRHALEPASGDMYSGGACRMIRSHEIMFYENALSKQEAQVNPYEKRMTKGKSKGTTSTMKVLSAAKCIPLKQHQVTCTVTVLAGWVLVMNLMLSSKQNASKIRAVNYNLHQIKVIITVD
jgi:hypothetical protein